MLPGYDFKNQLYYEVCNMSSSFSSATLRNMPQHIGHLPDAVTPIPQVLPHTLSRQDTAEVPGIGYVVRYQFESSMMRCLLL